MILFLFGDVWGIVIDANDLAYGVVIHAGHLTYFASFHFENSLTIYDVDALAAGHLVILNLFVRFLFLAH